MHQVNGPIKYWSVQGDVYLSTLLLFCEYTTQAVDYYQLIGLTLILFYWLLVCFESPETPPSKDQSLLRPWQ